MGSLFKVNIMYTDLKNLLSENAANQKIPVYATVLDGDDLYAAGSVENAYILMGSESSGIHHSLLDFATHRVTITASDSAPDSLNVAIATGIICYEFRRPKK
jgi:TrmH family RNA methyltransferase